MQINQIMTAPAVTVGPNASLHEAIGTMLEHRIGSVVVVDQRPIGILTRSDVLRVAHRTRNRLTEETVGNGMSGDLVTTTGETTITSALKTMKAEGIKKLPVLESLELVGIITMTDIARHQPERIRQVRDVLDRKDEWTD